MKDLNFYIPKFHSILTCFFVVVVWFCFNFIALHFEIPNTKHSTYIFLQKHARTTPQIYANVSNQKEEVSERDKAREREKYAKNKIKFLYFVVATCLESIFHFNATFWSSFCNFVAFLYVIDFAIQADLETRKNRILKYIKTL